MECGNISPSVSFAATLHQSEPYPSLPPSRTYEKGIPHARGTPFFLLIEVEFFGNCFAVFYFDGDGVLHLILE